jgi:PHP family Zn ribbon phosphoesterase
MYYKNIATCCFSVKDVKSRLGSAKFLESSKSLYKWMEEMMDKYDAAGIEMEGRADTSFASEALVEKEDPTANTRMVV